MRGFMRTQRDTRGQALIWKASLELNIGLLVPLIDLDEAGGLGYTWPLFLESTSSQLRLTK